MEISPASENLNEEIAMALELRHDLEVHPHLSRGDLFVIDYFVGGL
jgi:hypothetical protein